MAGNCPVALIGTREEYERLLNEIIVLPRVEISRFLVEPQRKVINLIANRAEWLRQLDAVPDEIKNHELYGMF